MIHYDRAIQAAAEAGIRNHEALANELAAEFLLRMGDKGRAVAYLRRSLMLYGEWNAYAIVRDLESRHKVLVNDYHTVLPADGTAREEKEEVVS